MFIYSCYSVPKIDENTLLQKVIPADKVDSYLAAATERDLSVGGFVARYDDVSHMKGFDEIYESLRLDYPGSVYIADKPYGIIRYKATNADKFEIPYGEKLGGSVTDTAPCTKNGFLAGRNGEVIAEYKAPYAMPQEGAALYLVHQGREVLVAKFKDGKFIPE